MIRWTTVLAALACLVLPTAAASAQDEARFGIRAGFSINPDQLFFGGHVALPPIAERVEFMPSAEIGFGDDLTSFAVNGDFKYRFKTDSNYAPYAGAGATANWFDGNGDFGINLLGGISLGSYESKPVFLEAKIGLGDVPDAKFLIGVTF
jgi:hypothetical protein